MSTEKRSNPCYNLLLVAGVIFVLTISAYCIMVVRTQQHAGAAPEPGLVEFMSHYGNRMIVVELAVIAVCSLGVMLTDDQNPTR